MSENSPAARLLLPGLTLVFLAFWAGLLWLLGRTLSQLVPAALVLDPAVLLLWLTLGPMTLHLAQALFYVPPKPAGPPVFIRPRLFEGPLVFLPLAGPGRLETGPAFFASAGPGDQARLLAEAEARLSRGGRAGRLSLLLADRSPLDLALRVMALRARPLAVPALLLRLLTSPTRQLMRLWGFFFFMACRRWDDPGPAGDLTLYKRRLAWDLRQRAGSLDPPTADDEDEDALIRRLDRARARLGRLYQKPGYGAEIGEPWPEAGADQGPGWPEPEKTWLAPRYRGVFTGLPATLYAPDPDGLYAAGRPEKNLGLFHPPELAPEAEAAALLAAEKAFLADLLAGHSEEGLIRLDGRLRPIWDLAAELDDLEARYDRALKRISTHHARCRAAHLAAAEGLGQGWTEVLRDWGALLWLAEHGRRLLTRAREDFQSALAVAPHSFPRPAAEAFYAVWADLRERLAGAGRPAPPDPGPPAKPNRPGWRSAWPAAWAGLDQALAELRDLALAGLLTAEDQVARGRPGPAPAVPWRPLTADFPDPPPARPQPPRVYYPSTRFKVMPVTSALSAMILAILIWQGWNQGLSQVTIYNGLPAAVTVTANGRAVTVPPFGHRAIRLRPGGEYEFQAAAGGLALEKFWQRLAPRPAGEIYNVAGASPLMEWWFPRAAQPGGSLELFLGRPRWLTTRATVLFEAPSGDQRALVLSGYGDAAPAEMLAPFTDPAERAELARLHARHTPPDDPLFQSWLDFLTREERETLLRERRLPDQAGTVPPGADDPPPPDAPDLLELMGTGTPRRPGEANAPD